MRFLRAAFAAFTLLAFGAAVAQSWPQKPVRVIHPFAPGGGAEAAARMIGNALSGALGQPFVIEARPGANTIIGADAVAKSAPDGYTFLVCAASTMSVNPTLFAGKLPYDPQRDFAPIGLISRLPFFVVVPAASDIRSMRDLVAAARAKPGALSYGSNGNGTAGHIGWEQFKRMNGIDIVHIPYKGLSQVLVDLLGGRLNVAMADLAVVGPAIRDGRLRAIGTTTLQRSPFLPEVPTVQEQGFAGYDVNVWFGLFAPANTPAEIVNRANAEMRRYLATAEARKAFEPLGHEPAVSTPDELRALVRMETERFAKIIRDAGIKAD